MEINLNARAAAVKLTSSIAVAAVHKVNEDKRCEFFENCNRQRQRVLQDFAWEFRQLLCTQQQILSKANVPGFNGISVDSSAIDFQSKVCSILHAAFILRNKVGKNAHHLLLQTLRNRLVAAGADAKKEIAIPQTTSESMIHPHHGQQQGSHRPNTLVPPPRMANQSQVYVGPNNIPPPFSNMHPFQQQAPHPSPFLPVYQTQHQFTYNTGAISGAQQPFQGSIVPTTGSHIAPSSAVMMMHQNNSVLPPTRIVHQMMPQQQQPSHQQRTNRRGGNGKHRFNSNRRPHGRN